MSPNEEKDAPLLPWDNFSNWVHAICVVTFDLELGQAMEVSCSVHFFFFLHYYEQIEMNFESEKAFILLGFLFSLYYIEVEPCV